MQNGDADPGTRLFVAPAAVLKRAGFFGAVLLLLAVSGTAHAYPPNYQPYVIGERARGMGGAYTAAGDDPMASYYNPGGLAFASSVMISVSQNLYSIDYRKIEGGFVPNSPQATDAISLEHNMDLTFPSTLAILVHFGGFKKPGKPKPPKNHTLAFSIITPYRDSYSFRETWQAETDYRDSETYHLSESYRVVWTGLSYAYRYKKKWGFGMTMYLSEFKYVRKLDSNLIQDWDGESECGQSSCGYIETRESDFDMRVLSFIFKLGVLWQPTPKWRFGFTVTTPNITVGRFIWKETKGKLNQTLSFADVGNSGEDYVEFYTDKYNFEVDERDPLSIRLGAAYFGKKRTIYSFDVTLSIPVPASYDRISGDPVEERRYPDGPDGPVDPSTTPEWVDNGIVRKVERVPMANVNLGGEWVLIRQWTVRSGLYSDLSSAPKVVYSDTPQETRVFRIGGTYSIGYRARGYDLTLGVTGTFGLGKASVYHPEEQDVSRRWQPADYLEYSVYVFIAGIGTLAEKSTKEVLRKVEDYQKKEGAEKKKSKENM